MEKTFSIRQALTENTHPHSFTFTDAPFKGLRVRYADLPDTWADLAEEAIGAELASLGFDPPVAIQALVSGMELTGEDRLAFRDALDKLTTRQKTGLNATVKRGFVSVLAEAVGGWNDPDTAPTADVLETMPMSFLRALFALTTSVTLSTSQRDFLGG